MSMDQGQVQQVFYLSAVFDTAYHNVLFSWLEDMFFLRQSTKWFHSYFEQCSLITPILQKSVSRFYLITTIHLEIYQWQSIWISVWTLVHQKVILKTWVIQSDTIADICVFKSYSDCAFNVAAPTLELCRLLKSLNLF